MRTFDAVVIGLGGIGSSALYHLTQRGVSTLGLEQFTLAHDRGSSFGQTRLIRRAYFEHPDFVPLVDRSFDGWAELEKKSDTPLFCRTGLILAGPEAGPTIAGTRRASQHCGLDIQDVDKMELGSRFPGFSPPVDATVLFEPGAGMLAVEDCICACVEIAQRLGADVRFGERVLRWSASGNGVTVDTDAASYRAKSLIIAAGPWTKEVLVDLGLPLTVRRQPVFWFASRDPHYRSDKGCPVFGFEIDGHFLYGFPSIDGATVKMADHTGGQVIGHVDELNRDVTHDDLNRLIPFIESCVPGVEPRVVKHHVCMYTMTPDEHFIIDRHPHYPNVAFTAGFSGHGFKFAPVIGSALADLVLNGRTDEPIGFLSLHRPSLRTP